MVLEKEFEDMSKEEIEKFLRTAPMGLVQHYYDWKLVQARKNKLGTFTCPKHGGVNQVYVQDNVQPLCPQCDAVMEPITVQTQALTTLAETVCVPKYYNTDGSPVKFGPKTYVSRRANETVGKKEAR